MQKGYLVERGKWVSELCMRSIDRHLHLQRILGELSPLLEVRVAVI